MTQGWDYAAACKAAADRQGITEIAERLEAAGFTVEIEQTGGFTMVATIRDSGRLLAFTDDGGTETTLLVGRYDNASDWGNGEPGLYFMFSDHAEMVAFAKEWALACDHAVTHSNDNGRFCSRCGASV